MNKWKVTEIGRIPEEWNIDKLENHLIIKGRIGWKGLKISEYVDKGPYIVGGLQIKEHGIDWSECAHITTERYTESPEIILQNEDILMTKDGTIGKLAYINNLEHEATVASHIHVVRKKTDNIFPKFLFYFFKSPIFKLIIESKISGSVVPALTQLDINNTVFPLPLIPEQRAIALVLSSLDDKIDLLHRQNKTLEAMAETLFRKWFVDEVDESWSEKMLGEYFPVITGKKDANFSTEDGQYPFFTCSQNVLRAPNYSFEGHAILLAGNGDFNVKRYVGKFEAYQRTYVLIPIDTKHYNFLYVLVKYFLSEITGGYQGSVINFITKGMITDFRFNIPNEDITDKLNIFDLMFFKFDRNTAQIRTLQTLRDTLLPKLMSGSVRIAV